MKLAIYISTIMIAAGVFLPLAVVPVYGEVTYNGIAEPQSYVVIGFSLSGVVLLVMGSYSRVWLAALGIWITLLFPLIKSKITPDRRGTISRAVDTITKPAEDLATDFLLHITELSWGGLVLVTGCAIFTVASLVLIRKK